MDNQQIEINTPIGQNESIHNNKEEFDKNRNRIINQIYNVKQTFSYGLKNIEEDFLKSYDLYLQNLNIKLKEYDTLIEEHIISPDIKSRAYSQLNLLLQQMLQEKIDKIKKYINDVNIHTQKLLDISSQTDFSKANDIIKNLIQEIKEKQREEDNKKIKENEIIKEQKENLINEPMEENINKNINIKKTKIEINGEIDINLNINLIDSANLNYDKLVLKKTGKDYFMTLFSQSKTINSRFHNKNEKDLNIQREGSVVSMNGEATPNVDDIQINKINLPENEKNKITDISIIDSNFEDVNISHYFPNIKNLKIINTKLSYNISEILNFEKLDSLILEGIGLIKENFNDLFDKIRNNEIMRKNLRIFSVRNNNISFLDFRNRYADNILAKLIFKNLEILDISYNKLYFFQNQFFNTLEKIKLIDITNNNIAFPSYIMDLFKISKAKKCLVLMSNNLAVLKDKSNIEYNQYLMEILPEMNYPIKKITLSSIFCNNNFQDIFKINIGRFKTSL